MIDADNLKALRAPVGAIFIGIFTGIAVGCLWLLVFTQFAVVAKDTPYPDDWTTLTSKAQVDWLREHTVILSGFAAVEHMAARFSEFANHFYTIFGLAIAGALGASLASWYVHRGKP